MNSLFKDVDKININGGSFNINQLQHNGLKELLPHIAPNASHSSIDFELPKCYPGTRKAIMKDLINWVENAYQNHPIYHLYAPVGSGKTAIAKTLSDHFSKPWCHSNRRLLASFFFCKTAGDRNNVQHFIATIAYQIAVNLPCAKPFIMEAIANDPAIVYSDLQTQMQKLILEPLQRAYEAEQKPTGWPRLLVIDALDECNEQNIQSEVLSVIADLARRTTFPLAIFLSCRPECHIRRAFQTDLLKKLSIKTNLSEHHAEHDIRLFLESKFKEIRDAHNNKKTFQSEWPGNEVIDTLVKKSSGHFMHASDVAEYVGAQDDNPVERLEVMLGLTESSGGEKPFNRLDASYMDLLQSIKKKHIPIIMDAFSFALQCPLGLMEKDVMKLLLDKGGLRVILETLQGTLISIADIPPRAVRVEFHAPISDFLLDSGRSGIYHLSAAGAHAKIVVYILKHHIENIECNNLSKLAIETLIRLLPLAAPTDELYARLQCLIQPQVIVNVVKLFNTPDNPHSTFDPGVILHKLICALEKSPFKDASSLSNNFWKAIPNALNSELRKYIGEPLGHLLALMTSGARFPLQLPTLVFLRPLLISNITSATFFWTSFDLFNDSALPVDKSSLNLRRLLVESPDNNVFRQMIKDTGHPVDQDVYTSSCVKALGYIASLNHWHCQLGTEHTLVARLSYVLKSVEATLESGTKLNFSDPFFSSYLWNVVIPLLEKSGPSQEILIYLEDLARVIGLLCHDLWEEAAEKTRLAILRYLWKHSNRKELLAIERKLNFGKSRSRRTLQFLGVLRDLASRKKK